MYIIEGSKDKWEVVVGLEVHAQIVSKSKLFSSSATTFGTEQNMQVSFVDAGMPGMLPVLNIECVDQAIRTGLGLNAKINHVSTFDRKNYFYPDLPQGYQISQFTNPIVGEGVVMIDMPNEGSGCSLQTKGIRITRIHIEQDAGKSIHDQSPNETFIDLNRAGVALMEIVTEPDIRAPEEAVEFIRKLRSILRYLGTCDGNMEQGSLRCDANISVRPLGSVEFGTRVEVKNLNSTRFIAKAIAYEAERQVRVVENGVRMLQETRLFDTATCTTRVMRDKENATDYRYFPDPDLLPLVITPEHIEELRGALPELPDAKKERYVTQMGLSYYDASVITADKAVATYFEQVAGFVEPKLAANWIISELFCYLKKSGITIERSRVTAEHLAVLLRMVVEDKISGKIAKEVFAVMFETGESPLTIVEREKLGQTLALNALEEVVSCVMEENAKSVEMYKNGEEKVFGFLVGQVMKKTQNRANPKAVNELLRKKL